MNKGEVDYRNYEKGDLHIHLNGAIPTSEVIRLLYDYNISADKESNLYDGLRVMEPAENMQNYFRPWKLIKKLPIGYECLEDMVDSFFHYCLVTN